MVSLSPPVCDFGRPAVEFDLPGVDARRHSLASARGPNGLLVMFICNHCPYVLHVNPELLHLAQDYGEHGVGIVAISANDAQSYPQDGPAAMREHGLKLGYPFPYLYDASQDVARAYDAACTPDFFLFDADLRLAYRGRLDGATPGNQEPVDGRDLRAALDALLAGQAPSREQHPSLGCNIKWRR